MTRDKFSESVEIAFSPEDFDRDLESPFLDMREISSSIPFESRLEQYIKWRNNK